MLVADTTSWSLRPPWDVPVVGGVQMREVLEVKTSASLLKDFSTQES